MQFGMADESLIWTAVQIVAIFVAIWLVASYLTGLLSGWLSIARHFQTAGEPDREDQLESPVSLQIHSGLMRLFTFGRYGIVVQFTPTRRGLFLSVPLRFQFGRPPLLVPWDQVALDEADGSEPGLVDLLLGDRDAMRIRIPAEYGRSLTLLKSRILHP
jgi:hypothetical protein